MRKVTAEQTEERSTQFAIEPMMLAERDRVFLKQCKANRDAETALMKDVPGWEVGTYYGIKLYNDVENVYNFINWPIIMPIVVRMHLMLKNPIEKCGCHNWTKRL